jgi:hypothetical protein
VTDPYALVAMLADDARRRVFAALVLGAATVEEVKEATGLATRSVGTAVSRLVEADLVLRGDDGTLVLLAEAFRQATIAAAPARTVEETGDAPEDVAKVLRTCFRDGRLLRIPAKRTQRLVVLDVLAQEFEVGRRFPERHVNATLRRFHDDVAALRRHLVDEGFLDRDKGEYWRSGGST